MDRTLFSPTAGVCAMCVAEKIGDNTIVSTNICDRYLDVRIIVEVFEELKTFLGWRPFTTICSSNATRKAMGYKIGVKDY